MKICAASIGALSWFLHCGIRALRRGSRAKFPNQGYPTKPIETRIRGLAAHVNYKLGSCGMPMYPNGYSVRCNAKRVPRDVWNRRR